MPGLPSPRPDIRPHPRASWHHHASTGSCAQLCGYKTVVVTKHLRADPLAQSGLGSEVFSVCAAQPHSMCESIQASLSGAISARSTADTVKPKRLNRHTTLNEVDGTSPQRARERATKSDIDSSKFATAMCLSGRTMFGIRAGACVRSRRLSPCYGDRAATKAIATDSGFGLDPSDGQVLSTGS